VQNERNREAMHVYLMCVWSVSYCNMAFVISFLFDLWARRRGIQNL